MTVGVCREQPSERLYGKRAHNQTALAPEVIPGNDPAINASKEKAIYLICPQG